MSKERKSSSIIPEETVKDAGLDHVYKRHGTIDLVPLPSNDPDDPLNWPSWRKHIVLILVAFHAFLSIFSAAIIIPAYEDFSLEFGVSLTEVSYFSAVQILFLGVAPLFWAPVSARYGRRPIYLFSALTSAACAFGAAFCRSYGTLMTAQVFQSICISPPVAIGAATVREMFFQHELGQKLGVWTLLVTIGPPVAPLVGGFVVQNNGWHWLFYLLAILDLALFCGYAVFGLETLYLRPDPESGAGPRGFAVTPGDTTHTSRPASQTWRHRYLHFQRIDTTPIRPIEFIYPFSIAVRLPVLLCALAYAVVLSYAGILITVLVPQFFQAKFGLDDEQIGLQFISLIIGAVLGEQLAGYGSDRLMRWRTGRAQGRREPEMRLLASWPGFLLAAVGVVIWGVQLQNAPQGQWNVTPDIGGGIAYFGVQLVTTPLYAYCLECYPEDAAAVSSFVVIVRQVYGFTVPFYLADGAEALGDAKEAGLLAALTGAMIIPVWACEIWGKRWRQRHKPEGARD